MEKKRLADLKKTDKLLLLFGVGLLLVVLSWPGKKQDTGAETDAAVGPESAASYEEELERRLASILSRMEGVGKVEVMITFQSSEEKVVQEDTSASRKRIEETDSSGGERKQEELSLEVDTLTLGDRGEPYVLKELAPQVQGVLVVAEGGDLATVKAQIVEAVQALFPLEAHKIKVLKRGS